MSRIILLLMSKKIKEEFVTVLKLEGHEVITGNDDISAISTVKNENPDVVIVDTVKGDMLTKELLRLFPKLYVICWMYDTMHI